MRVVQTHFYSAPCYGQTLLAYLLTNLLTKLLLHVLLVMHKRLHKRSKKWCCGQGDFSKTNKGVCSTYAYADKVVFLINGLKNRLEVQTALSLLFGADRSD